MHDADSLEIVAESLLREIGLDDPPVDAFEVAAMVGCALRPMRTVGARLLGDVIEYDERARLTRQHGLVAHEIGHWALRWAGESDSEAGASYLAGALLVPRRALDRQLGARWCLVELCSAHPNASCEMIAHRVVALRSAVALVVDNGRVRSRIVGPSTPAALRRPTVIERDLAALAVSSRVVARHHDRIAAWPVIDGDYERAVVISDVEALTAS